MPRAPRRSRQRPPSKRSDRQRPAEPPAASPRSPSKRGDRERPVTPRAASPQRPGLSRALVALTGAIMALGLIGVGLFVVLRGASGSTGCDPDAAGWNGAGGGPRQTGDAPGAIHDPQPGWRPVWQFPASGAAPSFRAVGPPSVAGGTVYVPATDGTLLAVDGRSGALQWSSSPAPGESGVAQTPVALDGCAAVVATSFHDAAGEPAGVVRAVDLRTHRRRWGVHAADEIFSAPQVVDGVAYAGLAFPATAAGALDRIHVLDGYYLSDGSTAYRKRFAAAVLASPTSDHQRIWIGDLDQNLYALGPGGRQLWTYTTAGIVSVPAVYDGNSIFAASADHHVAALDPGSGREKWSAQVGDVQAAMAVGDGTLIVAEVGGTIHALSSADGTERWQHTVAAHISRAVVMAGDRVFVVDDGGALHVLDVRSGAETAVWTAPAPPAGPPAIAAGHLYLTCEDGRLYALSL